MPPPSWSPSTRVVRRTRRRSSERERYGPRRGPRSMRGSRSMDVPPDQVEQREEEDPDDVDEVPVEPGHLDGRVPLGRVAALPRLVDEDAQETEPDDHVEGV